MYICIYLSYIYKYIYMYLINIRYIFILMYIVVIFIDLKGVAQGFLNKIFVAMIPHWCYDSVL